MPDILEGRIEPGKVFDRAVDLDDVPSGYRAMADRKGTQGPRPELSETARHAACTAPWMTSTSSSRVGPGAYAGRQPSW